MIDVSETGSVSQSWKENVEVYPQELSTRINTQLVEFLADFYSLHDATTTTPHLRQDFRVSTETDTFHHVYVHNEPQEVTQQSLQPCLASK